MNGLMSWAVAMATILLLLATACGVAQEEYDAAVAQRDVARSSVSELTSDKEALQQEKDSLTAQIEELQDDLSSLQGESNQLQADLLQAGAEVRTLESSLSSLDQEKGTLESQNQQQQNQLTSLQGDLQELQTKYPAKRFSSRAALEDWLAEDDISERSLTEFAEGWYSKALLLQKRALEDGYIVNADFVVNEDGTFTVWNSAVTETGNYFYWDPESDELTFELNTETFE